MDCGVCMCVCVSACARYVRVCHHRVPPFMIALSLFYVHTTPQCVYATQTKYTKQWEWEWDCGTLASNNNKNINNNNNNNNILSIRTTCVKSIVLNFTFMFSFTRQPNIQIVLLVWIELHSLHALPYHHHHHDCYYYYYSYIFLVLTHLLLLRAQMLIKATQHYALIIQ